MRTRTFQKQLSRRQHVSTVLRTARAELNIDIQKLLPGCSCKHRCQTPEPHRRIYRHRNRNLRKTVQHSHYNQYNDSHNRCNSLKNRFSAIHKNTPFSDKIYLLFRFDRSILTGQVCHKTDFTYLFLL